MECKVSDLRYKEVISVTDGTRYGYVTDLVFDPEEGRIRELIVPGPGRFFFGLFGRRDLRAVNWSQIRRFGTDIILVEGDLSPLPRQKERKSWFSEE